MPEIAVLLEPEIPFSLASYATLARALCCERQDILVGISIT
jgi:hypothetical protein